MLTTMYLGSCLYDCIEDINLRATEELLKNNEANPNIIISNKGIAPFHLAVGIGTEKDAIEFCTLLLKYDGNPNIRSDENVTPVHIAAAWGRKDVLNILLKSGGDFTLKDDQNKTALSYAIEEEQWDAIKCIETYLVNNEEKTQISNKSLTFHLQNALKPLPRDMINSRVQKWCETHANSVTKMCLNRSLDLINLSSDSDDNLPRCESRESGILTIPSSDTDGESSINTLNKCMIMDTTKSDEQNSSDYKTCASLNSFEKNIFGSLMTSDQSDDNEQIKNLLTSDDDKTEISDDDCNSFVSAVEHYEHIDKECGVVLIEKRILPPRVKIKNIEMISSSTSKSSSLSDIHAYDTDTLRRELTALSGEPPGPITTTTKLVYYKKLKKLKRDFRKNAHILNNPCDTNKGPKCKVYSIELQKTVRNPNWKDDLSVYKMLEEHMIEEFSKAPKNRNRQWREGSTKTSFTYLLLDPRITNNLPSRAENLDLVDTWQTFLSAIFYVGKGKRSRPYAHLYEAVAHWNEEVNENGRQVNSNKKLQYILDIWSEDCGVVCLHVFQNVIPVEAYTREAAMIHALMLKNLCNIKTGEFYGICATWPERQKRLLGVYLLYKAMLVFMHEGERQLTPNDIGVA